MEPKYRIEECFTDPTMFCSSLMLLVIDRFGTDAIWWEPEVLHDEICRIAQGDVDALTNDKINAALSVLQTNAYHKSLAAFGTANTVFNFKYATPDAAANCTLDDILWGCTEVQLIEGPEDFKSQGFTHAIAGYVGLLLSAEGVSSRPTILDFAEMPATEADNREVAFQEDPDMSEMNMQRQSEEVGQMNDMILQKLAMLFTQYRRLPLSGSPEISARVGDMLKLIMEKDQDVQADTGT